ncbi:MAG: helix-turn-helix transcriptional regulator [Lachnospiraceae bacterium]|nr:helix-turn-helix transcriptional regulator [Lachnospiraceae bacterium]
MIKSRVYQKVRLYLSEHGIEEICVAHKVGIPLSTFNAILNGEKTLYADDLRAICYALDVSPEEFIEPTEKY